VASCQSASALQESQGGGGQQIAAEYRRRHEPRGDDPSRHHAIDRDAQQQRRYASTPLLSFDHFCRSTSRPGRQTGGSLFAFEDNVVPFCITFGFRDVPSLDTTISSRHARMLVSKRYEGRSA
jgi:hypothetical protein